jgi:hypothetical protein
MWGSDIQIKEDLKNLSGVLNKGKFMSHMSYVERYRRNECGINGHEYPPPKKIRNLQRLKL